MIFKIKNCNITVSYYCFTFVAAAIIFNIGRDLVICFLCALLHEAGHISAVISINRKMLKNIDITPFGANIKADCKWLGSKQKIIISAAGPAVNIITFTITFLLNEGVFTPFSAQNLALGIFNLLPIVPLDGSNIAYELLYSKFEFHKAQLIIELISVLFIVLIFSCGFLLVFRNPNNFFLLFISVYLVFLFVLRNLHEIIT